MIKEENIQVFIDGTNHYFKQHKTTDIVVGTPYLLENETPKAHDYTGIIGISGPQKGSVYFTAPQVLLQHLLVSMKIFDTSEDNLRDLVGEIANTISGNARTEYGPDFNISVPLVIKGAPDDIHLPKDAYSYVIPIEWQIHNAAIVVCLQDK